MIQINNCQLEIDVDKGVLYVHSSDGVTLVRVCQIPARVMEQSYSSKTYYWKGPIDVVYDRELAKGGQEAKPEKLVCDRCGVEYIDEESVTNAKRLQGEWEALCRRDGVVPRGLASCTHVTCPGELILREA